MSSCCFHPCLCSIMTQHWPSNDTVEETKETQIYACTTAQHWLITTSTHNLRNTIHSREAEKKDRIEATKGKVYLTIRSAISVFVVFNQSSHRYNFDRWRFCKSLIHSHLYRSQATYHTGHITFRLHIHHLTFILGGGGDGGEITGKNAGNPVATAQDGFSTITSVKPLDIGFSW